MKRRAFLRGVGRGGRNGARVAACRVRPTASRRRGALDRLRRRRSPWRARVLAPPGRRRRRARRAALGAAVGAPRAGAAGTLALRATPVAGRPTRSICCRTFRARHGVRRRRQPRARLRRLVARQLRRAAGRLLRRQSLRVAPRRATRRCSPSRPTSAPTSRRSSPTSRGSTCTPGPSRARDRGRRSGDARRRGLRCRRRAAASSCWSIPRPRPADRARRRRERRPRGRPIAGRHAVRAARGAAREAGADRRPIARAPRAAASRSRCARGSSSSTAPTSPALSSGCSRVRKELTGPTARVHDAAVLGRLRRARGAGQRGAGSRHPACFAVGARDSAYTTWQTGWCGGLGDRRCRCSPPAASARARARCRRSPSPLDGGQAPSGFFHGVSDGKTWYDDGFTAPLPPAAARRLAAPRAALPARPRWHLVRRSADTLTFLVKQLALLDGRPPPRAARAAHRTEPGRRRRASCADALVRLWERYRQLGQFVDIDSGELIVGGSTSAGMAPGRPGAGGRLLQGAALSRGRAGAAASTTYDRFVRVGLTCGGPGDALAVPGQRIGGRRCSSRSSPSTRSTRDRVLDRSRARRGAPAGELGDLVRRARRPDAAAASASVRADRRRLLGRARTGRGSPGYVLSSGDALFRLYRATGDVALLELLRDTVHNLAQYLRAQARDRRRPRRGGDARLGRLPARRHRALAGAHRRASVPAAGVYDAIALLSYTEVPGRLRAGRHRLRLRVRPRRRARQGAAGAGGWSSRSRNPTRVEATVRLFAESARPTRPCDPGRSRRHRSARPTRGRHRRAAPSRWPDARRDRAPPLGNRRLCC